VAVAVLRQVGQVEVRLEIMVERPLAQQQVQTRLAAAAVVRPVQVETVAAAFFIFVGRFETWHILQK
jgi:hypothetical protein